MSEATAVADIMAAMDTRGRTSEPDEPITLRRWEAAETNRLNQAHWQNVTGNPINQDLLADLERLRTRCSYEAFNNGIVDGVINTHAEDIVGADGPTLQVLSDSPAYNTALEQLWPDWFSAPCPNRRVSGAALLKLWIRGLWTNGEFLAQHMTGRDDRRSPVRLRIKPIHTRRLATPHGSAGDKNVIMGVRLSEDGQPQQYHIAKTQRFGAFELLGTEYEPISADMIIHEFLLREEDQARGVPWLSSSLSPIADLRDYDAQTLDAARSAADQAIFWYAEHPDAPFLEVNESMEIERRTQSTGPPGWKPMQLTPQQPTAQYVEYRRERQAEIGRPVGMPLMMVRLDSARHSYSSARFDGQIYARSCRGIQYWISGSPKARGTLSDLADEVAREGGLIRGLLPPRPPRVQYAWLWPEPPHVDPQKEAQAERITLENGTQTYTEALAARGKDLETTIATRKRETKKLAEAGLPGLPVPKRIEDDLADQPDDDQADDVDPDQDDLDEAAEAKKKDTADAEA